MDAETFEDRLQRCVDEAMQQAVTAGAAVVTVSTQTSANESYRVIDVQPANAAASPVRLVVQSQEEVSLFVGPPEAPGSLTVDLWDRDEQQLLQRVSSYLSAVLAGRMTIETLPGSSAGRVTFTLDGGVVQQHHCNASPRSPWGGYVHRFDPYSHKHE